MEDTLYNSQSSNCCGFCNYHRKAITVKQLHRKKCISKNCPHLIRYKEHPYWSYRAWKKNIKKKRRQEKKDYFKRLYEETETQDERSN